MVARGLICLALAACGRIDFAPVATTGTGGDAGGPGDTASAGDAAGSQMTTIGAAGTRDASITVIGGSTTWNYGASQTITVTFSFRFTGLLRFDLSAIPTTAIIRSATLELTNTDANADTAVDGYELLEDWDEGTLDGAPGTCNWMTRMSPSTAWSGAGATGASRSAAPLFSLPAATGAGRISVPIPASTIAGWLAAPATNYGIELYGTTGTIAVSYASRENTNVADRPALVVTYD